MRESTVQFGRKAASLHLIPLSRPPRRGMLIGLAVATGVLLTWSAGTTGYILLKDDLAAGMIRRQVALQHAYEQKIAQLRMQVDQMASKRLLDQDSIESQVAEIMSRQSAIETRHALIAKLAQDIGVQPRVAASAEPPAQPAASVVPSDTIAPGLAYTGMPKPTPIFEAPLPGRLRETGALPPREGGPILPSRDEVRRTLPDRVSEIRRSLGGVAAIQAGTLRGLADRADRTAARLRTAIVDAGVEPPKPPGKLPDAVGGPLVPLDADSEDDEFARAADRVRLTTKLIASMRATAATLPVRSPLAMHAELTSGFGSRQDPFTRGLAMHTGVDYRAPSGTPVKATGAGVVITAEYRGGYGRTVEIDHGNGLSTRYAHLSTILVEEGERVSAGTVIGQVGSTGRSTGPHLHYETRVRGEAADPLGFLRVGQRHKGVF